MSAGEPPPFFDFCRAGVADLLDAHVDMETVERTIDAYALQGDEKDALWLWAIGRRDHDSSEPVSVGHITRGRSGSAISQDGWI